MLVLKLNHVSERGPWFIAFVILIRNLVSIISLRMFSTYFHIFITLRWRHNGRDSVTNHQPHDCLLNHYSDADQIKHQSSTSPAFVRGIHRGPMNSPHKWPVMRKMLPFDDVIMIWCVLNNYILTNGISRDLRLTLKVCNLLNCFEETQNIFV